MPFKSQRIFSPDRSYAKVADDKENVPPWPKIDPPNTIPNPYQIFNIQRDSPYSKARFYELVKIYHPDRIRNNDASSGVRRLSQTVRVERYRLVIAANDILSDPVKRNAYDRCGAGWNGQPETKTHRSGGGEYDFRHHAWSSPGYEAWKNGADDWSPHHNATWEDWERWYSYRAGKRWGKQQPVFAANGAFISTVVVLGVLGGVVEAMRWGNHSASYLEQRDRVNDEASQDLRRRRNEAVMRPGRRDESIQKFLRVRDHGPMLDDGYSREMLPEPEIRSGGDATRD
ncbi:MAG: hypothetical protein M1816_007221 [Peltula sp. TS41687]|nr:MAG: hypothetical protein M1816_007221 [Peltula sp. TS41687]